MTQEQKAKAYDEALEKAKEIKNKILCSHLSTEDCKAVSEYIDTIIPELREKPLTPFQQCLNLILQKVYYSSVPGKIKDVDKFILDIVKNRTDELVELAKRQEKINCQLRESEDERIRQKLMWLLQQDICPFPEEEVAQMLTYLEKQKELPTNEEMLRTLRIEYEKGVADTIAKYEQKEQKPAEYIKRNSKEWYALLSEQYDRGYWKGKAAQKPAEWNEEDEEALREVKLNFELNHDDMTSTLVGFYERFFNKLKSLCSQPKAEWNEEDEKVRKMLVELVKKHLVNHERCMAEFWLEKQKEQNLTMVKSPQLKEQKPISFNEPYNPDDHEVIMEGNATSLKQKKQKQEWSEEDEEIFNNIIEKAKGGHWIEVNEITWLINRFKSLRPQSKDEIYKEKDEAFKLGKHQLAIKFMNYLDENRPEGKMSLSNGECEDIDKAFKENDWAKIMRYVEKYRPSWKPSEEQMEALKNSAYGIYQNGDGPALRELYEQLKKL